LKQNDFVNECLRDIAPSNGRVGLKRITRATSKTKIFAKLQLLPLEEGNFRVERDRKKKQSEECEVRIDEAFRDTAKRVRYKEKGDQDSKAKEETRKRR